MLFRLILLLALLGALVVFTMQNLTPLLPLVFLGIRFPALPLAWWVLGAIVAGAASMLSIQVLFGLSNFVTGQKVRSRFQAATDRAAEPNRWTPPDPDPSPNRNKRESTRRSSRSSTDDSAWQDWRGYEASPPSQAPSSRSAANESVDDWERPLSDDWEGNSPQDTARRYERDRPPRDDVKNFQADQPTERGTRSPSTYSYGYQDPKNSGAGKPEPVVDADFRVIVPPYNPVTDYTPPPPPPTPPEENADDWFEETSDEFGGKPEGK